MKINITGWHNYFLIIKNMKKLLFLSLLFSFPAFSQIDNQQLGRRVDGSRYYGNYYDYSDPGTINIKVSVWGYVRSPGKYLVPISTTISDLISYAGGPDGNADLDEIRLYRIKENGEGELIKFDFNDLLEEDQLRNKKVRTPTLTAGDTLILPGSPKYYFRDWLGITLSIFSAIVSLTILILNITR